MKSLHHTKLVKIESFAHVSIQGVNRIQDHFQRLRKAYPGSRLLIVSNTAGTAADRNYVQAKLLEKNTGVTVLRHNTKVCKNAKEVSSKANHIS
jgi:PGP phosphatase